MNEKKIKCILIDYLMEIYPQALLIGVEIPYISMKRRVDVLLITEEKQLIAFEIKSDQDNLKRLPEQITDYKQTFDKLYIVTSKKYNDVIKKVSKNIGGISINGRIYNTRSATQTKRLSKKNLSYFLQKRDFHQLGFASNLPIFSLRNKLIKMYSTAQIHEFAIKSLLCRYSSRFELFKKYKERNTTEQDLDYLTKSFDFVL